MAPAATESRVPSPSANPSPDASRTPANAPYQPQDDSSNSTRPALSTLASVAAAPASQLRFVSHCARDRVLTSFIEPVGMILWLTRARGSQSVQQHGSKHDIRNGVSGSNQWWTRQRAGKLQLAALECLGRNFPYRRTSQPLSLSLFLHDQKYQQWHPLLITTVVIYSLYARIVAPRQHPFGGGMSSVQYFVMPVGCSSSCTALRDLLASKPT